MTETIEPNIVNCFEFWHSSGRKRIGGILILVGKMQKATDERAKRFYLRAIIEMYPLFHWQTDYLLRKAGFEP